MRRLLGIALLLPLAACSKPGTGVEMQAARALELRRAEDAYRLLAPLVVPALDAAGGDSAFAATLAPEDRAHRARQHVLFARSCLPTMRTMLGVRAAARAIALEPGDPEAHGVKALLDQRRFRNVAAVAAASEAVRLAPEEAEYRIVLGETLLGGGMVGTPDYERAVTTLREALRLDPGSRRARFALAKALVSSGDPAEGEALLDSLLTDGRVPAEARLLRGLARMRRRELAGAESDFRAACRLQPTSSASWFNWSRALDMSGEAAQAEEARRRFQAAQDLEEMMRPLEVAFHSNEDNLGPALELGSLLARSGRAAEAIPILETASRDHPGDARAPALLAEAATSAGDAERAAAAARLAVERAPNDPRAHMALSNALALGGGGEEALAAARAAVAAGERSAEAHATLGRRLLDSGDAVGALRELQSARRLAPDDAAIFGSIGVALVRAEAWEEAEQALGAAIARLGPRPRWLAARGKARAAMGRTGWAADDFRGALAADPEDSLAANGLIAALRAQERGAEADSAAKGAAAAARFAKKASSLRAALARDPFDADRAEHLARLLREAGRPEDAEAVLVRAFAPGSGS